MSGTDLIDRLAEHKTVGAAPRRELEWLAAHGSLRSYEAGDALTRTGTPVEAMFVFLSGRVTISVDRGAGPHKIMVWQGGIDVSGVLPYSRLVASPGDAIADEPTTILAVPREHLPEMIRECHELTSILVHKMLDRARLFTTSDLHDEKMASLGKLSAGLAHELNNPASAIKRSAVLLKDRLEVAERATRALGAFRLTESQWTAVDAVRASCLATRASGVRSPVAQAEREDRITDWLETHGLDASIAEALAETEVTFVALDRITGTVVPAALESVLRWAAAGCAVRELASEIQEAAQRISSLVTAIKGFTHMDQAAAAEPVDLTTSLDNTVAVLKAKARAKSVAVTVDVENGLPPVQGFAGELNQVWANLIDNALDAVPDAGRVDVSARRERPGVIVRVIDDGPGIPEAIRERIFDPFFTTKPVGQGTGLGLDIVRRLVRHNDGEIEVDSRPGRTEFRVTLPLAGTAAAGGGR